MYQVYAHKGNVDETSSMLSCEFYATCDKTNAEYQGIVSALAVDDKDAFHYCIRFLDDQDRPINQIYIKELFDAIKVDTLVELQRVQSETNRSTG